MPEDISSVIPVFCIAHTVTFVISDTNRFLHSLLTNQVQ